MKTKFKKFIVNKLLKGSAAVVYLILFSPLLIAISLMFGAPFLFKATSPEDLLEIVPFFFPFLFLVFLETWKTIVVEEIIKNISFNPNVKYANYITLGNFIITSIPVLFVSLFLLPLLGSTLDSIGLTNLTNFLMNGISYLLSILFMVLFVSLFIAEFWGNKIIAKLIIVHETQTPFVKNENYRSLYRLLSKHLMFNFGVVHNRIKRIVLS